MWYRLINLHQTALGTIAAEATVPRNSPWFSGHFPEDPVLPGIALLEIVAEMIREWDRLKGVEQAPAGKPGRGKKAKIENLHRVRFKRIIRPGDRFNIAVNPTRGRAGHYSFRILAGDLLVCSGNMKLINA